MEYLLTNDQPLLPMSTSADILEGISDALYVLDRDWRFTYLNERASVILQRSREELLGKTVWEEFPDVAGTVFDTEFHRAMAHGTTTAFEVNYHRLGGWFELRVYPSPDGLVIFFQDINTRKHADAALRESEARYRTLINHLPAVTYTETLDPATRRVQASPQIEALTGYSLDEWETRSELWISMIHRDDRKQVVAAIERTDATGEPFQMEYRCVRKDGRVIWIRNEAVLLNNQAGQPAAWQGFMIDITERKALEAQLVHAAHHDALTGLPNRALFLERAQQALAGAQRSGRSIAVLFLDLDNFKLINDTFGHIRGDELLIRVAAVLRMGLHAGETLTRLGGDEFVILIEELADVGDAVVVADRQLERLRQPLTLAGRHVQLSASIGIVVSAERHSTPVELLRDADIALYQAKDSGKQRVVVFESAMHAAVMERRELEAELRVALERNEFVLHFQPIMALATGTIDGVEALVRWQHPTRGFISPLTFIPIAEASGLIHALGEWVLREACSHAAAWCGLQPGAEPFRVSVNLSSQEFAAPDLVTRVSAVLTDIKIHASVRLQEDAHRQVSGFRIADVLDPSQRLPRAEDGGDQLFGRRISVVRVDLVNQPRAHVVKPVPRSFDALKGEVGFLASRRLRSGRLVCRFVPDEQPAPRRDQLPRIPRLFGQQRPECIRNRLMRPLDQILWRGPFSWTARDHRRQQVSGSDVRHRRTPPAVPGRPSRS